MKMRKLFNLLTLIAAISISTIFTGCLKESAENESKYSISTTDTGSSIIAKKAAMGVEVVVEGNLEEESVVEGSLLKIVKTDGTNTTITVAGNISEGMELFSTTSSLKVLSFEMITDLDNTTTKTTRSGEVLLGDFDSDDSVGIVDFTSFAKQYGGTYSSTYDIGPAVKGSGDWSNIYCTASQDQAVNLVDFIILAGNYGATKPTTVINTGDNTITFNGTSITTTGTGTKVSGTTVTITAGGTYNIAGTLSNGQILVNSTDSNDVYLNFNGVNITNTTTAPVMVESAKNVFIVLGSSTKNYVTDGTSYVYADATTDEPDAAIFSKDDLTIKGSGELTVKGNYKEGIKCKDELQIDSGIITVTSADDGIIGKDDIVVNGGTITITSTGDGLKSTEDEDTTLGYVTVNGGTINIISGADAIQGETTVTVNGGALNLKSAGGSTATLATDASGKGIKANTGVTITGGTTTINSADDGINSDGYVNVSSGTVSITSAYDGIQGATTVNVASGTVNITTAGGSTKTITSTDISAKGIKGDIGVTIGGGTLTLNCADDAVHTAGTLNVSGGNTAIATGDDGLHSDAALNISGGTINITKSYEGVEGVIITFTGGTTKIVASDDGVNAAGGVDGSGTTTAAMGPGGGMQSESTGTLNIKGGYIYVNCSGDGLDCNGVMTMTAGTAVVYGPTDNGNAPIDYDSSFTMSGGYLMAAGSSGMAQQPSAVSNINTVMIKLTSAQAANSVFSIRNGSTNILTVAPPKTYSCIVLCAPALALNTTYTMYTGATASGTATDYIYGSSTGGTTLGTFTTGSSYGKSTYGSSTGGR